MCALIAAGLVLFPSLLAIVLPTKRFARTGFAILTISIIALPFQSALADTRLAKCLILCTFDYF